MCIDASLLFNFVFGWGENMERKIKWKMPFSIVWLRKENRRDKK